MRDKSWGQIAYEAYLDYSGGTSLVSGQALPEWKDQALNIKNAWEHTALKLRAEVLAEIDGVANS
jgi:hypothetical protein